MQVDMINSIHSKYGPGLRSVVWVHGLPYGWPDDMTKVYNLQVIWPTTEMSQDEIALKMCSYPLVDGFTICGGEPWKDDLTQDEIIDLVLNLRTLKPELSIIIYTGHYYDEIKDTRLANIVDIIIAGPYIKQRSVKDRWYSSDNQEIIYVNNGSPMDE